MSEIEAFFGLDATTLALIVACYLLGGAIKGALGFGLPMAIMASVPLFAPVDLALGLNSVVAPLSNLVQAARARSAPEAVGRFWPVLLGICVGAGLGAAFVASVDKRLLLVAIGVFVLGFSTLMAANPHFRFPPDWEKRIGLGAGVLAGLVGVISTVNGPVFVIYLVSYAVERRLLMSALGVFFLLSGAITGAVFWAVGFLDGPRLLLALICLGPTVLTMTLGDRLMRGAAPLLFRRLVLGGLCVLAANLIWRGWRAL